MRSPKLLVLDAGDDLAHQVERATSTLRPRPQVVHVESIEAMDKVLPEEDQPFDLLIAGAAVGDEVGLKELRRLRTRMPETGLILAFDRWRSTSLRETVRTGALDILRLPAKDEVVADAIEQALQLHSGPLTDPAPGVLPAAAPRDPSAVAAGSQVVAVISASGGCGKTFFATNLAYYMQSQLQQQTCVIDLDLQFGELSTALRLKPRYTITDLVGHEDDELGRRLVEYAGIHETGVRVLAAPDEPAEADNIDPRDISRVIEAARTQFDAVVIDTPASLNEAVLGALEHADQIFVLATLDLPSVRNLGLLLKTFEALKVPTERVELVLNKVEPDVGIDIPQVSKYFPQGFSIVIPYGREVSRALNMGMPILAFAPRTEVAKMLLAGLSTVMPGPDGETTARTGRLGRAGRRHKRSASRTGRRARRASGDEQAASR